MIFLFGLLLGFLGSAEPVKVYVGVYVLNLGKFELATGAYTVDFYLSLRSQEPVEMGDFEFMNGRAATVDKLIDTPTESSTESRRIFPKTSIFGVIRSMSTSSPSKLKISAGRWMSLCMLWTSKIVGWTQG